MTVELRDIAPEHVAAITAINVRNRTDLERTDPPRPEVFYTPQGQAERIARLQEAAAAGRLRVFVIVVDGTVAGDIGIEAIERGYVMSGRVGYLVDGPYRGRGVASEALRQLVALAFGAMGLHRLEAGVLRDNIASQRVLEKAGFRRVGLLERSLYAGGAWRDNHIYELVGPDVVPTGSSCISRPMR